MSEAEYQSTIRALAEAMRTRAGQLADFLVTQPPRGEAMRAARNFGWWCLGEGATQAYDVQERIRRQHLARHGDGAAQGETDA